MCFYLFYKLLSSISNIFVETTRKLRTEVLPGPQI